MFQMKPVVETNEQMQLDLAGPLTDESKYIPFHFCRHGQMVKNSNDKKQS